MKNIHVSNDITETNCRKKVLFVVPFCSLLGKTFADRKVAEKEVANEWMFYCSTFIEDVEEFSEGLPVGFRVVEICNLVIDEFHDELEHGVKHFQQFNRPKFLLSFLFALILHLPPLEVIVPY